jgi:hypothetical protein
MKRNVIAIVVLFDSNKASHSPTMTTKTTKAGHVMQYNPITNTQVLVLTFLGYGCKGYILFYETVPWTS